MGCSGMGCMNRELKNLSYEVERINGGRRQEKVISVFEWLNNYVFTLQLVSEPIEK